MQSASSNLKRITLELGTYPTSEYLSRLIWAMIGGNDPLVVLPDVDPELIAPYDTVAPHYD